MFFRKRQKPAPPRGEIRIEDGLGNVRAALEVASDGTSYLHITDVDEDTQAFMQLPKLLGGKPHCYFLDDRGQPAAGLSLSDGELEFFRCDQGKLEPPLVRFSAPEEGPVLLSIPGDEVVEGEESVDGKPEPEQTEEGGQS